MSARDELVAVIIAGSGEVPEEVEACDYDVRIADAVLAAGYSKPRTITTVEELDALPGGSIILEVHGDVLRAIKRHDGKNWWIDGPDAMSASALIPLPVTVIHEPEEAK